MQEENCLFTSTLILYTKNDTEDLAQAWAADGLLYYARL